MATKITIDELVTKYIFEVDPKGAKEYEKLLDKSTARHKTETAEQTKNERNARQKQLRAAETAERQKRAAVEKSTKAGERAAKRFARASERASKRSTRARAKAAELTTAGDMRAAGRQTRIAQRAARAKERAEIRAQRSIMRASRRATRAIERDLRRQEKAARKASRAKSRGAGGGAGAAGGGGLGALGGLGGAAALGPAGLAAAGAAAGIAAAGKAISFVGDETERLDKIAKGAQVTGLGFKAYQELSQVATLSGTSIDTLAKGTIKLDRNLADVADGGGKKIAQNLTKLGLSLDDFEGKTQTQKLAVLSDALAKVDDDAQKTVIAIELMGKSGADLVPLLNSGSAAIDNMSNSVGKIFSREDLAKAEAYQDSLANLNKSLDFIKGSLVVAVTPAFQDVSDAIQAGIPAVTEYFEGLVNELSPAFNEFVDAVRPWVERFGPGTSTLLSALLGPLRTAARAVAFFAKGFTILLNVGNRVMEWIEAILGWIEDRWPRAFSAAAAVVNALIHPLDTVAAVIRRIFDFIAKSVGKIDGLAGKVREIRAALNIGEDQEDQEQKQDDKADDQAREGRAKGAESRLRAREANLRARRKAEQQSDANAADAEAKRRGGRRGGKKRGKGGGTRAASGLEAQIDSQIKQSAAQAEIRASAQALQAGKGSKEAFAIGREAARQTEKTIRGRFDETGELPEGIARDISQLARSPAVEESIGRVPPPVISVVNNVTNNTVSGNEFSTNVDATLTSGVGVADLEQMSARATIRLLNRELGNAIPNVDPQTRV